MSTGMILSPGAPAVPGFNGSTAEPLLGGEVLYEVVGDEFRELPPMSAGETRLTSILLRILGSFAWSNSLGLVDMEMLPHRRPSQPPAPACCLLRILRALAEGQAGAGDERLGRRP